MDVCVYADGEIEIMDGITTHVCGECLGIDTGCFVCGIVDGPQVGFICDDGVSVFKLWVDGHIKGDDGITALTGAKGDGVLSLWVYVWLFRDQRYFAHASAIVS